MNESIEAIKEVKVCLLCGNEGIPLYQDLQDRLFSIQGVWSLICCPECDFVWLNPRPISEDIGKLYAECYTHVPPPDRASRPLNNLRKMVKYGILATAYDYTGLVEDALEKVAGKILSWVCPLREAVGETVMWLEASRRGRLLDVGCGNGQFLAHMRGLGWEVIGVEPDSKAVHIAKEHFGLKVFQGTLEEAKFPDDSFDAITMNHVIEHVPEPMGTLAECRRLLQSGGKLVVVTPNIRSLGRYIFGEYWRGWEVPRHLFLFSSRSLRTCTERAGLRVQRLWVTSKIARWIWSVSRLIRQKGKLPGGSPVRINPWFKLESFMFGMMEYMLCAFGVEIGEELVLEATKG